MSEININDISDVEIHDEEITEQTKQKNPKKKKRFIITLIVVSALVLIIFAAYSILWLYTYSKYAKPLIENPILTMKNSGDEGGGLVYMMMSIIFVHIRYLFVAFPMRWGLLG